MKKLTVFLSALALLAVAAVPVATWAKPSAAASANLHARFSADADVSAPCVNMPPGHLIAPGWLRKNGIVTSTISPCQFLPPGIAGKLNVSSTPPVLPPQASSTVISGIDIVPGTASLTVSWFTNRPANSQVHYGTTAAYGSSTTLDGSMVFFHSQTITGLGASTTYHLQLRSEDGFGNLVVSADQTATTLPLPEISGISAVPSSTSAEVNWTTNVAADSKVYYAIGSPVDVGATSTLIQSDAAMTTSHSLDLIGLSASTTYGFAISAEDAFGNTATSDQQAFVTLP